MTRHFCEPLESRKMLSAVLDSTFGIGSGINLGTGTRITSMRTASDGSIFAAAVGGGSAAHTINLLRFTPSGALDESFGRHGIVSDSLPGFFGNSVAPGSIQLLKNGDILIAGAFGTRDLSVVDSTFTTFHAFIVRLKPDGTIDSTFANNGALIDNQGTTSSTFSGVHADESGLIYTIGQTYRNATTGQFVLHRFRSTGEIDTTFGTAGTTVVPFKSRTTGNSMSLRPDGSIDATGNVAVSVNGKIYPAIVIAHLSSSGAVLWQRQLTDTARQAGAAFVASSNTLVVGGINTHGGELFRLNATTGAVLTGRTFSDDVSFGNPYPTSGGIFSLNGKDFYIAVLSPSTCSIVATQTASDGQFLNDVSFGLAGTLRVHDFDSGLIVTDLSVQNGALIFAGHDDGNLSQAHLERVIPRTGSIQVRSFRDEDRNQVKSIDEQWIANTPLWIDLNNNGRFDRGEPSARSTGSGASNFTDLAPGKYVVREQVMLGWRATGATARTISVSDNSTSIVQFGSYVIAQLGGKVINSVTSAPIVNWTVFIDSNDNGIIDGDEQSTTTDPLGQWFFRKAEGNDHVRVVILTGWTGVVPAGGDTHILVSPRQQPDVGHVFTVRQQT